MRYLALLLVLAAPLIAGPKRVNITGGFYHPTGLIPSQATVTVQLSKPMRVIDSNGNPATTYLIASVPQTIKLTNPASVDFYLCPNEGSTPAGTFYRVNAATNLGTFSQKWEIPNAASARIADVPIFDDPVASTNYVLKAGDTSTGTQVFSGSPGFVLTPGSEPASAPEGGVYYDSSAHQPKYYDGSSWQLWGSGGGGGSSIAVNDGSTEIEDVVTRVIFAGLEFAVTGSSGVVTVHTVNVTTGQIADGTIAVADLAAALAARVLPAPSSAGRFVYDDGDSWEAGAAGASTTVLRGGSAPSFGAVPLAAIQEVMALADLSDVSGKTGSGSMVVMSSGPTLAGATVNGTLTVSNGQQMTDNEAASPGPGAFVRNGSEFSWGRADGATNLEQVVRKNAASGYAGLDGSSKLTASQGQEVWTAADLSDLTATSLAANDVLVRNSSSTWVNAALAGDVAGSLSGNTYTLTIQAGAVSGGSAGDIVDGSITAADLGTDSVAADEIAAGAVGASELATGAVVGGAAGDVQDDTLTADDLAADSVGASELAASAIQAGDVEAADIAELITATQLSDVTVTSLAEHDILVRNGASAWVNAAVAGPVSWTLSGNTLTTAIGADAIGASQLASTAIQAGDIEAGDIAEVITAAQLSDLAVTSLAANDLLVRNGSGSWVNAASAGDVAPSVSGNTVTWTIQAGAVSGGSAGDIVDGSVTAHDLGTDSVAADELAADAVGASELSATAIQAGDIEAADIAELLALSDLTTFGAGSEGEIVYRDGSAWTALADGAAYTVLATDADGTGRSQTLLDNNHIAAAAGIVYSKLAFSNNIVAGDLGADSVGSSELSATAIEAGDIEATDLPAHASRHQNGGADEVATATPGANAIPKANGSNKLASGWLTEVLAIADLSDVTALGGTAQALGTAASNGSGSAVALSNHVHAGQNATVNGSSQGAVTSNLYVGDITAGYSSGALTLTWKGGAPAAYGGSLNVSTTATSGSTVAAGDVDASVLVTADAIVVSDGTSAVLATGVSATANCKTAGAPSTANGRDQSGGFGSGARIYLHVIQGLGQTHATLWSLSATAPTMPSNYTRWALVSSAYTNSAGYPTLPYLQVGRRAIYNGPSNASPQRILSAGTATSYTELTTAPVIPPQARIALLGVICQAGTAGQRIEFSTDGFNLQSTFTGVVAGQNSQNIFPVALTSNNKVMYRMSNAAANGYVDVLGWEW